MGKGFESSLGRTCLHCSVNVFLDAAGRVLVLAGAVLAGAILVERLFAFSVLNGWSVGGAGCLLLLVVVVLWAMRRPSAMGVALMVDERLRIQERFSTTLAMAGSDDPFAKAACNESRRAVEGLKVTDEFPIRAGRCWFYVIGVWIFAAGLVLYMPQKDLLGFLDKKEKAKEEAIKVTETEVTVKKNTASVRNAVERLGDSELEAELAKLAEMPQGAKPENIKREAIRKLGDLSESIKKMQSKTDPGAVELMDKMLKQLRNSQDAISQDLFKNLAKGDFAKAADVMEQLRQKLKEGKMTDAEKEALSKQLKDIAEQLAKLAEDSKELEKALEKMGLGKELAKLDAKALRQALQKSGLSKEKIEELMKKAQACKSASNRCSALAKAMGACASAGGGMGEDAFAAAMDALGDLESFKAAAQLSAAALAEIERAIACMGEGMCSGPGGKGPYAPGLSNRWGPGTGEPGKGKGLRGMDDTGKTSTKNTRVKNETEEGPVVASWYFKGSQIKGESKKEFSEVVAAGRDNAAEAISENEIPRKYEETVKKYFGKLEDAGGERD